MMERERRKLLYTSINPLGSCFCYTSGCEGVSIYGLLRLTQVRSWVTRKMTRKLSQSDRPDFRQIWLKGGWKRLDFTWQRENALSCQNSSFFGLWLQLHKWRHTINSKWLTLWIKLDRTSRTHSTSHVHGKLSDSIRELYFFQGQFFKLCTACYFSGNLRFMGKYTTSWIWAVMLSLCHSSTGLILSRREGKPTAWQLH